MVIPGYRQGTEEEHCGNCGSGQAYVQGRYNRIWCKMYRKVVKRKNTCERWNPRA